MGKVIQEKIIPARKGTRAFFRELGDFFKRAYRLASPYWKSKKHRKMAWFLLIGNLLCIIADALIVGKLSFATADMINVLTKKQVDLIPKAMGLWIVINFVLIFFGIIRLYFEEKLLIEWREFTTHRFLKHYLSGGLYHQMELADYGADNPDQRLGMDMHEAAHKALEIGTHLLRLTTYLFIFGYILWTVSGTLRFNVGETPVAIPGYMFWTACAYGFFVIWAAHKVGKRLIPLNIKRQRLEADFRYKLIRVGENSESVALLEGDQRESRDILDKFSAVRKNWLNLLRYKMRLQGLTRGLAELSTILPYLIALPALLFNSLALGSYLQLIRAFGRVEFSISYIAHNYHRIAELKAHTDRLLGLEDAMTKAELDQTHSKLVHSTKRGGKALEVEKLSLNLPTGTRLLEDISLSLSPGEDVVVTGQSGSGKSTLFRALSGHWIWGEGNVFHPDGNVMFLPQRPYLPIGTLKESLVYPNKKDTVSDVQLKQVMQICLLSKFCDRLDEEEDWVRILSGGEQQRLSIVRAMIAKPDWLFLDEATSALDPKTEGEIYKALERELPNTTLVSVAHRKSLKQYHDKELRVDPNTKSVEIYSISETVS